MRSARNYKLTDPWLGSGAAMLEALHEGVGVQTTSTNWPTANLAIANPIVFPVDCTIYQMQIRTNGTTDNFDMGFYTPWPDFKAIARLGSTATSAATQTLTIPDYRVKAGLVYYAAVAMNGTTSGIMNYAHSGSVGTVQAVNILTQTTAFALPDPLVPNGAIQNKIIIFMFGIR